MIPAAADEVSVLTAAQFTAHAQMYQAVGTRPAAIHEVFVSTLSAGGEPYATTEATDAITAG